MDWMSIFGNPWFYGILLALTLFAYGVIRSSPLGKLPLIRSRKMLMWVGIIGLAFTLGLFGSVGSFGTGSFSSGVTASSISGLQVTTAFVSNNSAANAVENGNYDDVLDIRLNDAQVGETAGEYELAGGVIKVTRSGDTSAWSCPVRCQIPADFVDEGTGVGPARSILEVNGKGEHECYLNGASTSTNATTSSAKEITSLPFAEGIDTAYLGVALEVDEEAHDYLDQYNSKPIVVDVCGVPYTFNVYRMDA
ncbi:MAG: energy-coupling factor transporter transmembrane protein EcfT [Magnetococcus sp. YQC-3]